MVTSDLFEGLLWSMVGMFPPLAPVLGPDQSIVAISPPSTLPRGEYGTKCDIRVDSVNAVFVRELISSFNLNPVVYLTQTSQGELCVSTS